MEVGRVSFWTDNAHLDDATNAPPHSIVCDFPTVGRLYEECKIEWIEEGLKSLRRDAETYKIQSIGIPAIGCGIVGHPWSVVHQMIVDTFEGSDIDVYIYPPR
jgi:O-acetyl-ADP-ribose deacetylase (regulator of RNase III)